MANNTENTNKRKMLIRKLKNRYRLVVMNDTTFDERFSAYLTPLNVIAAITLAFILIASITVSVVVFTPIKEYIPGYSDTQTRLSAISAAVRVDSLEDVQSSYENYFRSIRLILNDQVDTSLTGDQVDIKVYDQLDFSVSHADSLLRNEIESQEKYVLTESGGAKSDFIGLPGVLFFAPIRGAITATYDFSIGHYGIDVVADEGEAIKAVYDGVVILASFTSDGGNVIQIQHPNNLVSMYKHASILLKKVGDQVSAGESIAIIGNSGEFTDGPHLHFELWYNGIPLNPQDFIAFSN